MYSVNLYLSISLAGNGELTTALSFCNDDLAGSSLNILHTVKTQGNFCQENRIGGLQALPPADPLVGRHVKEGATLDTFA